MPLLRVLGITKLHEELSAVLFERILVLLTF